MFMSRAVLDLFVWARSRTNSLGEIDAARDADPSDSIEGAVE
jgi:hypothetical protein